MITPPLDVAIRIFYCDVSQLLSCSRLHLIEESCSSFTMPMQKIIYGALMVWDNRLMQRVDISLARRYWTTFYPSLPPQYICNFLVPLHIRISNALQACTQIVRHNAPQCTIIGVNIHGRDLIANVQQLVAIFFSPRNWKHPSGSLAKRAIDAGYWCYSRRFKTVYS